MGEWGEQGAMAQLNRTCLLFLSVDFQEELLHILMLAQVQGGSKFWDLGKERSVANIWSNLQVFRQDWSVGSAHHYAIKNGNLEGLCLALSWVCQGGIHESSLSHGEGQSLQSAISQNTQGRKGGFLTIVIFRNSGLR